MLYFTFYILCFILCILTTPVNFPAPPSESSCGATRPGLFLFTRSRTCVYAHAARHRSRVVVSLLHWKRMLCIMHHGSFSDGWHGQFCRFTRARLLYYPIAMCSPLFRALLAWRMAFQKFAPYRRKLEVLQCSDCFSPVRSVSFDMMTCALSGASGIRSLSTRCSIPMVISALTSRSFAPVVHV